MPIPIASYGNNANVGSGVREALLPDYEIVHGSTSFEDAKKELPALAGGDLSVKPASGLGTNTTATPQVPKAIIVGGSISAEEVAELTKLVQEKAPGVPIVQVTREDVTAAGGSGPDPAIIAKVLKEKLGAAL
ncbi:hypothetical protein QBC47DRAFT_389979 [Echria macrotheca]|uniref:Uncharacterized protein n=1 Tax=Echria macrotheca TaxID=438768 RepID=A0AAJ0B858_9PEZI|nr:hypothetical protein QBC47DRAFT_389979 [Echria macrotheca]